MRWSKAMREEAAEPGEPSFLQPRTAIGRAIPARVCRGILAAMALLVAVAAGPGTWAQAAPAAQRFVVVLDAAHGGDDAGARLGSQTEKAYTLALSVRLRSLLTARGFTVVTTRETDEAVDADHRAEIANHAAPQACLSLHATLSGSGVHLFISSMAPVEPSPLVPWKTAQAAWIDRSVPLAGMLNSALYPRQRARHAGPHLRCPASKA